eukprot:TRINITY_DN19023_c0_g1_i1.p1 TRINITY_DN19023_c0_g1~~TRINITY_DN19023_c0_g1_i1.p1  ORF type:complete len:401 (+),score=42.93 TRINITY_DN19023_c0_g1_i1:171-1205(+)
MAVFVRVQGIAEMICVELGPDATVADLRREAAAQVGQRRVTRLRFAGESLTDSSVALADAGIGPQAVVDAEGGVSALTFVEGWHSSCQVTFDTVEYQLPVSALEGLRLGYDTRPHARLLSEQCHELRRTPYPRCCVVRARYASESPGWEPLLAGRERQLRHPDHDQREHHDFDLVVPDTWHKLPRCIKAVPEEVSARLPRIEPGMHLELYETGDTDSLLPNPFANTTPEEAQRIIRQIQATPKYAQAPRGVQWRLNGVPPALTVAVKPHDTLMDAWRQACATSRLSELQDTVCRVMGEWGSIFHTPCFALLAPNQRPTPLDREALCCEIGIPDGSVIEWILRRD